jgi:hypothetical protein
MPEGLAQVVAASQAARSAGAWKSSRATPAEKAAAYDQGSEQTLQIVSRELRLAQDAVQQSGANCFPGMDGNHGGSAIGMTEKVMAAFHPQAFKPQLQQHIEQLLAAEDWQPANPLPLDKAQSPHARVPSADPTNVPACGSPAG